LWDRLSSLSSSLVHLPENDRLESLSHSGIVLAQVEITGFTSPSHSMLVSGKGEALNFGGPL